MNFLQVLKNFKFKLISPFFFESQDEANHSSSLKCPPKSSPHIDELSCILMSTSICETPYKKKKEVV
jgi:hypothetical protein